MNQPPLPHKSHRDNDLLKRFSRNVIPRSLPPRFIERVRNEQLLRNQNYVLYLSSLLKRSQLYHLLSGYLSVFRKFKLVSILIRLYSYLLLLLQFGTAFFVIVIALVLLIPIALLSIGCVLLSALLFYDRKNRYMAQKLNERNVFVLFPTRDGEFQTGRFWRKNIEELSKIKEGKSTVLVVSPFFWSFRGVFDHSPYFLIKEEKQNIYLIRKHYYFSLRKKVLSHNEHLLTLIY